MRSSSADAVAVGVEDQPERELALRSPCCAPRPRRGRRCRRRRSRRRRPRGGRAQPRPARAVEDVDAGVADVARRLVAEDREARPRSGRACRPASPGRAPSLRGGSTETRTGAPRLKSISRALGPLRRLGIGPVGCRHHGALAGDRAGRGAVEVEADEGADDPGGLDAARGRVVRAGARALEAHGADADAGDVEVEVGLARRRAGPAASARARSRPARVRIIGSGPPAQVGQAGSGYAKEAAGGQGANGRPP